MKRPSFLLILILTLIAACKAPVEKSADALPLIITSIYPYELLVKQMVGDAIEVRSLIPANTSVHSFSPQPSDLKDLHKADLILINGMGLEAMFEPQLNQLKDKLLISEDLLSDLIALDSLNQVRDVLMHSHEEEEEHHHPGADPHLWTSIPMMTKLATKLRSELVTRFPDAAPVINHNFAEIVEELAQAHDKITSERSAYPKPALVTYHNSFHYFTRDYDILYLGWVQSSPGKEPGARDLANLGAKIRSHNVRRIFIEPQQNPKSAEVLAKEYRLELGTLDPIGASLNVSTITELILKNWEAMKLAF